MPEVVGVSYESRFGDKIYGGLDTSSDNVLEVNIYKFY